MASIANKNIVKYRFFGAVLSVIIRAKGATTDAEIEPRETYLVRMITI